MRAVLALAADPREEGRGAIVTSAQLTSSPPGQALGGADNPPVFSAAEHGLAFDNHSSGELGWWAALWGAPCMGQGAPCCLSSMPPGAGQPLLSWLGWPPSLCWAPSPVCRCRMSCCLSSLLLGSGLLGQPPRRRAWLACSTVWGTCMACRAEPICWPSSVPLSACLPLPGVCASLCRCNASRQSVIAAVGIVKVVFCQKRRGGEGGRGGGHLMCRASELTASPSARCYCSSAGKEVVMLHAVVCMQYGAACLRSGAVPSVAAAVRCGAAQLLQPVGCSGCHCSSSTSWLHLFLAPGLCSWQPLLHFVQSNQFQESRHSKPVEPHDVMASDLLTGGGRGGDLINHFMELGDVGGAPCPWQSFLFTAPPWLLESPGAEQVGDEAASLCPDFSLVPGTCWASACLLAEGACPVTHLCLIRPCHILQAHCAAAGLDVPRRAWSLHSWPACCLVSNNGTLRALPPLHHTAAATAAIHVCRGTTCRALARRRPAQATLGTCSKPTVTCRACEALPQSSTPQPRPHQCAISVQSVFVQPGLGNGARSLAADLNLKYVPPARHQLCI